MKGVACTAKSDFYFPMHDTGISFLIKTELAQLKEKNRIREDTFSSRWETASAVVALSSNNL